MNNPKNATGAGSERVLTPAEQIVGGKPNGLGALDAGITGFDSRPAQPSLTPAPRSMSGDLGNLAKKCDFCEHPIRPGEAFGVGPGCFFHVGECE